MERYGDARRLIEKKLLNSHPDDWSYWKRHLQCAMGEAGPDEGIGLTEAFVSKQIELIEDHSAKYPLRGPYLMRVEIAAERFRRDAGCHLDKLVQEIVSYGARFAPRAACTFSDLLPYVDILMKDGPSKDDTAPHVYPRDTLLEWIQTIAAPPSSSDAKARREELRTFIFSSQMRYRLVSGVSDEVRLKWMPNWVELLSVWKAFQDFDTVTDDEQVRLLKPSSVESLEASCVSPTHPFPLSWNV
jgi:N-terminal acetyltransferase B complex non-catalytic subunit